LNNCFVAPQIKDSLDDIFDKVKLGAMTHQKGGGIGYDFSQLRPKGTPTSNDAIASGAISFMDCFNAQTATILQGNRRK
jgi:ribonucleoside-diphosphate reductase alpha chain